MTESLIQQVFAQTDGTSHPTIPFVPPGGFTTPTAGPTPGVTPTTGPTITLTADQDVYNVGESGTIAVAINTKAVEIDEFTIIIEYDPTHIQILDSDFTELGIQVDYLNDHFELQDQGNLAETGITESESGQTGKIKIETAAKEDIATTITNQIVAEINFSVLSSKTSEMHINTEETTLLLDNTNRLDEDSLEDLTINSLGGVLPTPSIVASPTPIPKTAIDSTTQSMLLLFIGSLLVITGFFLQQKIKEERKATSGK
jgi:hypothetical protein